MQVTKWTGQRHVPQTADKAKKAKHHLNKVIRCLCSRGPPLSTDPPALGGRICPTSEARGVRERSGIGCGSSRVHRFCTTIRRLRSQSAIDLYRRPVPAAPRLRTTYLVSDKYRTFSLPGQDARLSFSGTAGQLVNLAVSNSTFTTAGRCLNYSILNPDGSQLTTALTCGAGGALNQVSLPSTGTYTALISPMNGATGSATVTLTSD